MSTQKLALLTLFVGNKKITNCTAAGIKDALREFLKAEGLVQGNDYCRIVGLRTDGAAVITGRHNGLEGKVEAVKRQRH